MCVPYNSIFMKYFPPAIAKAKVITNKDCSVY